MKTIDGKSPLILVNGEEINSGIAPISPRDIEYVEVIDAIPAKYLLRGVTSILNIKLRDKRPPYIWTQFATRHEAPLHKGFGAGYFEIGNEKFSFFTRASVNYTFHSDSEGTISQSNDGYALDYDWTKRTNGRDYLGEILLKWAPSQRDHFVFQALGTHEKTRSTRQGSGTYYDNTAQSYLTESRDQDQSTIFTSSAYYKHKFTDESAIEATAQYNHNSNRLHTEGGETFDQTAHSTDSRFDNARNSGSIDIAYNKYGGFTTSLSAGSTTTILSDRIETLGQPRFKHSNVDEYLYLNLASTWGKVLWMLSPGLQSTWIKAGDASNNYTRFRGSVSATWTANAHNSLQAKYRLSNQSPEASQFNPYNTSTDSLMRTSGNPYLVPQMDQDACLLYTFNSGPVYAEACPGITWYSDMITPSGYTEPDGVYVSSYRNYGNYKQLYTWASISYQLTSGAFRSNFRTMGQWIRSLYTKSRPLDSFFAYIGINAWYRKFFFGLELSVSPKTYTDITVTRNLRPETANVQVNYSITDDLYVALCLQGFAGNMKTRVLTSDGTFRSVALTNFKETGFRPWILVRWTIRKNPERKIKIDKVLDSTEKGIRLK